VNALIELTYPDDTNVWIGTNTVAKVTTYRGAAPQAKSRVTCIVGDGTVNHLVKETPSHVADLMSISHSNIILNGGNH
jgi:carbonic anhydrase/acetyltransferase-like protein (isoleucine patch superfamily)